MISSKDNPFLSETFTSIWSACFDGSKSATRFSFISNLRFASNGRLPWYSNVGRTHTKGINYHLSEQNTDDCRRKTFLIYDIPTYFAVDTTVVDKKLGVFKTRQYPGFSIELGRYPDFANYMALTFSKSSRYKLNKYKKRLEQCFDIEYRMYFGAITKSEYDTIFDNFRTLLEKRFDDKQTVNNNLAPEEWNFYREVAYPMILEKKASLFVIYDAGVPIGVTLNYFSETILFDAITVFDIDYSKFHLGSVTVMKLIEWCIENNIEIFDFSKGYFEYKTRWSNKTYDFEYHIYYDRKSFRAKSSAFGLKKYFDLKQYLRDKKLNENFHRWTFKFKGGNDQKKIVDPNYAFVEVDESYNTENLESINPRALGNIPLKTALFEFLYLNNECISGIKVFRADDDNVDYLLRGTTKKIGISINN